MELGKGIGHFTGELAKQAAQVLAIDFTDNMTLKVDFYSHPPKFIYIYIYKVYENLINTMETLQNELLNGHFSNAMFMCADVTSPNLDISPDSVDLIFSNCLLMHLSDKEVNSNAYSTFFELRTGAN